MRSRKVICEACGEVFSSVQEAPKCIKCHGDKVIESPDNIPSGQMILDRKPIVMGADSVHLAQKLINEGVASNLNELMDKALSHFGGYYFYLKSMGDRDMDGMSSKEKITPQDIITMQMMDNFMSKKKDEGNDLVKQMILMKQLGQLDTNRSSSSDILPLMMMMQQKNQQQSDSGKNDMMPLLLITMMQKKEEKPAIDPLILLMLSQKDNTSLKELAPLLKNDSMQTLTTYLQGIEKIKSDHDEKVADLNSKVQDTQQRYLIDKIEDLKSQVQQSTQESGLTRAIKSKTEQLISENFDSALKNMKGEKAPEDKWNEIFQGTLDKIREPILAPIGQAIGIKIARESGGQGGHSPANPAPMPRGEIIQQGAETVQTEPTVAVAIKPSEEVDTSSLVQLT